ncbi:MAG: hypothetical protein RL748_3272 [Pseudomonadota bacterium]
MPRLTNSSTVMLCCAALALPSGIAQAAPATLSKDALTALEQRLMQFPGQLRSHASNPDQVSDNPAKDEQTFSLFIRYTEGTIFNPGTRSFDKVKLRAYQQMTDKGWDARFAGAAKFAAPPVVTAPGKTLRYKLYNQLPEQIKPGAPTPQVPSVTCPETAMNKPAAEGCFNITNLHSHGLWISPTGNSDNVLLSLYPSVNFEYEYNLPLDHPAGTFWYHPHVHGSTAMQVASGMTGALVVYGTRAPTEKRNGDLDTLLKKFEPKARGNEGASVQEILMFQQIPYGCKSTDEATLGNYGPFCKPGQTGVVENFQQVGPPTAWNTSQRYTSINGSVQPYFKMRSKQVVRWRLIDAAFQSTINLVISKVKDETAFNKLLTLPDSEIPPGTLAQACGGNVITQFEVASDGLTHGQIIAKNNNLLGPGYRSDILFSLPESGHYCVFDSGSNNELTNTSKRQSLLAVVRAAHNPIGTEGNSQEAQTRFLQENLLAAANYADKKVQEQVRKDLLDGLKLSKFVPHKSITDVEVAASNKKFDQGAIPIEFAFGGTAPNTTFLINNKEYDPAVVNQKLILGAAQEWNLTAAAGTHPFHIHVNPFQIISITNKNGSPLSAEQSALINTWRDTLLVSNTVNIKVRTRYERYIGKYVLHCHILEHEDQGMMQNVEVYLPDTNGKIPTGGHSH